MAKERILVVDDEETIRFVLKTLLSEMGHEVVAAGSVQEGLQQLSDEPLSAALLDLVLPDGSGITVLDGIKQASPDTEVIIMTSHASVETAIDAIRKGAYDYLHKPFELDEVSATVTRAIEKRSLKLRNNELMAELERHNRDLTAAVKRLNSLNAAGLGMSGINSLTKLLEFFLGLVVRELDVERASVMLLGMDGKMRIAAAYGLDDQIVKVTVVEPGEGIVGRVVQNGEPLLVEDVAAEPDLARSPEQSHPGSFISVPIVLSVPIKFSEAVLGAINVTNRRSGQPFNQEDVAYLCGLAGQAAVAIERARHHEDLQNAIASLQNTQEQLVATERLKVLGEMAAGVAHDINNTLNGILGRAQLLRSSIGQKALDPAGLRHSLETIENLANQGAATVRRIQDSARIRKDRPVEAMDLNAVVRFAVELTRPKWKVESELQGTPIEIVPELGEIPTTSGSPQEMTQVLSNLIFNAVEAMPKGGHIRLKTSTENGSIVLEIADDGTGIKPEIQSEIFEPFFTTKETGQGLGLSVAYNIVKRMGGSIEVESEPGKGTRFTIRLPVIHATIAEPQGEREPSPTSTTPARILIIDDEQQNRELFAEMLSIDGHEVALASTGAHGLALLENTPYDIVITDLSMPGMSGWQVAQEVKKSHPALPVIVLSGWGVQLEPGALREAGVELALAKPIAVDELLTSVRRIVGTGGEARTAAA